MTYILPGASGADGDDGVVTLSGNAANIAATGMLTKRKAISTAGQVATRYWRASGSGNVHFSSRVLEAMPVRLKS